MMKVILNLNHYPFKEEVIVFNQNIFIKIYQDIGYCLELNQDNLNLTPHQPALNALLKNSHC